MTYHNLPFLIMVYKVFVQGFVIRSVQMTWGISIEEGTHPNAPDPMPLATTHTLKTKDHLQTRKDNRIYLLIAMMEVQAQQSPPSVSAVRRRNRHKPHISNHDILYSAAEGQYPLVVQVAIIDVEDCNLQVHH